MVRGEIWLVDLGKGNGSIQGRIRPCVLVSNNLANKFSPVVHVCPVSSVTTKSKLPTHIDVNRNCGLIRNSIALCEQTVPVNKDAFKKQVGFCDDETMKRISIGVAIQFGLISKEPVNNYAYA